VSERSFFSQMEWLRQATKLSSSELLLSQDHVNEGLQVAITFDDGYVSLADVALPILKELGAVATVFANTAASGWERHGAARMRLSAITRTNFSCRGKI